MESLKQYRLARGGMYSVNAPLLLAAIIVPSLMFPIGQAMSGVEAQWEVVLIAVPLAGWISYIRLRPVECVLIGGSGKVEFRRGYGGVVVDVADVLRVRPLFNWSRRDFVVVHRRGYELLFEDPATVAALVEEIRTRNSGVVAEGLPLPPGSDVSSQG